MLRKVKKCQKWDIMVFIVVFSFTFLLGYGVSAEKIKLKFWDMVWGPQYYVNTAKKLVEKFNAEHPNIKVTYSSIPWSGYFERFTSAIAGGAAPDVSTGASFQPLRIAAMGEMEPLDDLYKKMVETGEIAKFFPGTFGKFYWNGHIWAIPWQIDPRVIIFRTDLFEEAGLRIPRSNLPYTWKELRNAAVKLTKGRVYGFTYAGGNFHMTQHINLSFMAQNGGGLIDEKGNLAYYRKENIEALKFLTDLAVKYKTTPPGIAGYDNPDVVPIFTRGRTAMIYTTDTTITLTRRENPELAKKISVMPPLQGPKYMITAGFTNGIMVYKQSDYPEEAKVFLRWWIENNAPLFKSMETHFPSQLPAAREVFKEDPLFSKIMVEVLPHLADFNWPASFGLPELAAIDGRKMFAKPVQDVLTGKMTPEEAVKTAQEEMKKLFEK